MIIKRVIRHGGSLAITIPAQWARELEIRRGDHVFLIATSDGALHFQKVNPEHYKDLIQKHGRDN